MPTLKYSISFTMNLVMTIRIRYTEMQDRMIEQIDIAECEGHIEEHENMFTDRSTPGMDYIWYDCSGDM